MMTKAGGKTLRATLLKKHGSLEAMREYFVQMGHVGGKASKNGGFASDKVGRDGLTGRERASKVGVIGGSKSRRGKS